MEVMCIDDGWGKPAGISKLKAFFTKKPKKGKKYIVDYLYNDYGFCLVGFNNCWWHKRHFEINHEFADKILSDIKQEVEC